jgi:putative ABC transport system permease protein
MIVALGIVFATTDTALPILMTPALAALLLILTVLMCAVSAIAAINKVTKIDPVVVFNR